MVNAPWKIYPVSAYSFWELSHGTLLTKIALRVSRCLGRGTKSIVISDVRGSSLFSRVAILDLSPFPLSMHTQKLGGDLSLPVEHPLSL